VRVRFVSPSRVVAVVGVMVMVVLLWLIGTPSASGQYQSTVIPKVNVQTGGTLNIVGGTTGTSNAIDFGEMGPGQTLEKTLSLGIMANNVWHLTVSKSQDLTDLLIVATIPSANLTFKSSGDASGTYVTSSTEFGSSGSPSSVVSNGSATGGSTINVAYKLIIPAGQPSNNPGESSYSAVHTYTLVVGSP
jgi:hypothetical protein